MDLGLDGKAALVMGGSEGVGLGSAQVLAAEGARVAIVARTPEKLQAAVEKLRALGAEAHAVQADLTDPSAVTAAVHQAHEQLGALDVLVNTVGLCEGSRGFLDQTDGHWQRSFDSVLMVAVRSCRAAIPIMLEQGHGAIVNTAAMSIRHYLPWLAHYSAQKAAVAHLTKNLAREFATKGLRINAVLPGMTASDSATAWMRESMQKNGFADESEFFTHFNARNDGVCWSNRWGHIEELGRVVAFLASDKAASYVNGTHVTVDGGSPV